MATTPASWKAAAAGEEELDYVLFDVQSSTTTANTVLNFFSRAESAQNKRTTNMPLASNLPSTQRFLVREVQLVGDSEFSTATDQSDAFDGGSVELTINKRRYLHGDMRCFLGPGMRVPPGVTNVDESFSGTGFKLERGIVLPGGTEFNVEVITGDTAPTAAQQLTVRLIGTLVRAL